MLNVLKVKIIICIKCGSATLCIREFIIDNNLDILFLCETWLGTDYDEISISEFFPLDYKLLHQARTNQRGGGVRIVYKGGLDVVKIYSSDGTTLLEYLTCKVIYADDLCIAAQEDTFNKVETILTTALTAIGDYYIRNQLRANPDKTQTCAFHLRNREAKTELKVSWDGKKLEHTPTPV